MLTANCPSFHDPGMHKKSMGGSGLNISRLSGEGEDSDVEPEVEAESGVNLPEMTVIRSENVHRKETQTETGKSIDVISGDAGKDIESQQR